RLGLLGKLTIIKNAPRPLRPGSKPTVVMETWVNYAAFLSIFSLAVCHDHSCDYLHFHSK
ncbi:hypothetical protein J6590_072573, partial [Homalodisca vitripennis]